MIKKLVMLLVMLMSYQNLIPKERIKMLPSLTLQGPQGRTLVLSEGHHVSSAGTNVYAKAIISSLSKAQVTLEIPSDDVCDGTYTQQQFPIIRNGQQSPPYVVWSKNGDYIALSLITRQSDSSFDFRNAEITAFDTNTGADTEFKGPTSTLRTDTFQNWSSEKPDVAILLGNNLKPEEAHRVF